MTQSDSRVVYPNVALGDDIILGPSVVIGEPPRGVRAGELPTTIGANTTMGSHTDFVLPPHHHWCGFPDWLSAMIPESNEIGDNVSAGVARWSSKKSGLGMAADPFQRLHAEVLDSGSGSLGGPRYSLHSMPRTRSVQIPSST